MPSNDSVVKLLGETDIRVNGDRSGDIRVNNPQLYSRVL